MCGLGGVFFKTTEHHRRTGEIAYRVLDGIFRRGPDSTGLALIQPASEDRLYVGVNCEEPGGGGRVLGLLDELGRVESATDGEGFIRTTVRYDGDDEALVDAVDALGPGYSIASIGSQLEIVKHMGGVDTLEDRFTITDYDGPLAMGLTRFATESVIDFTHGQPLSARLHRDLVIMHNGHITNFHHLRYHFERAGYTFTTGNDSEVIAVALIDEMKKGASFHEALERSVTILDGCFTYIAVTKDEVGVVKDPYAAKPLVVGETDRLVAVSSDCWALRDGIDEDIEVWEPGAGEVVDVANSASLTIDCAGRTTRAINEEIRRAADEGVPEVELLNPQARHNLGVSVLKPIHVVYRGHVGSFTAGLCDGITAEVHGTCGWGVADNLMSGEVVVHGNAATSAAPSIRGGRVVVRGDAGPRSGMILKKGELIVGGNTGYMSGFMMQNGRMIVCGDADTGLGDSMYQGVIFLGGTAKELGSGLAEVDAENGELDEVAALLDRYEIKAPARFRKLQSDRKLWHFNKHDFRSVEGRAMSETTSTPPPAHAGDSSVEVLEDAAPAPNGAYPRPDSFSGVWPPEVIEEIQEKAALGRYQIRGQATKRRGLPSFDDLVFVPAGLSRMPLEGYREKCDTRVVIGEGNCENPLVLERPIMIAGMSFGALSVHAKRALGTAASRCGISTCTGEGGMHHEERRYSDKLVMQYLPSRYGMNPYDLKKADMIEIGAGQGAKPGTGGVLLGLKMSDEVAEMRDLPEGVDQRSPCRHPDWMGADDLYMKLEEIREVTEYKVPISIKVGAARIANDVRIAAKAGVDAIVFDGMEGGTAASPTIQLDHAGIPTVAAIAEASEALADMGKKDAMKLIVGGGIRNGADAAKCIALGADVVYLGTAPIIAMGCHKPIYLEDYARLGTSPYECQHCHTGLCPVGITTQLPKLMERLDVDEAADSVTNYLNALTMEIQLFARACGKNRVSDLDPNDLRALTYDVSLMTGVDMVGLGGRTPWWKKF